MDIPLSNCERLNSWTMAMTTEADIQEIARRLGWEYAIDRFDRPVVRVPKSGLYIDPETNADLHIRWLGMLPDHCNIEKWSDKYRITSLPHNPTNWDTGWCESCYEAIRAALLAKLRSEQDAS
jgi:hypothetical protein